MGMCIMTTVARHSQNIEELPAGTRWAAGLVAWFARQRLGLSEFRDGQKVRLGLLGITRHCFFCGISDVLPIRCSTDARATIGAVPWHVSATVQEFRRLLIDGLEWVAFRTR